MTGLQRKTKRHEASHDTVIKCWHEGDDSEQLEANLGWPYLSPVLVGLHDKIFVAALEGPMLSVHSVHTLIFPGVVLSSAC